MGTEIRILNLEQSLHELRSSASALSANTLTHFAQEAVALFFAHHEKTGEPLRAAIDLLCEIASLPDPFLSRIGIEALFPQLIETLNDSFDKRSADLYDRLFVQVISFFRKLPEAQDFEAALNQFGLVDETAILARKAVFTRQPRLLAVNRPLQKIFFLSRVTIGADVAITSVLIAGLKQHYPDAKLILIGPAKLAELYGGDPSITILPVTYGRRGNLLARFQSWVEIVNVITREVADLLPSEFCVFDPDSRFTQLGLLPVLSPSIEQQSYYFFPSRTFVLPGVEKLGQLAAHWLNEICGKAALSYPFVSLSPANLALGKEICNVLRSSEKSRIICLSFGVGGNQKKRLSELFEMSLVAHLAQENKLVIDCGFTTDERQQAERLLVYLERQGKICLHLSEQTYQPLSRNSQNSVDVISWQGGIGSFAALIAASDFYLGYDSSGQHLAAAMGVPTLTIFVNSGSPIFAQRWHPHGKKGVQVIPLEAPRPSSNNTDLNEVVQRVLQRLYAFSKA